MSEEGAHLVSLHGLAVGILEHLFRNSLVETQDEGGAVNLLEQALVLRIYTSKNKIRYRQVKHDKMNSRWPSYDR